MAKRTAKSNDDKDVENVEKIATKKTGKIAAKNNEDVNNKAVAENIVAKNKTAKKKNDTAQIEPAVKKRSTKKASENTEIAETKVEKNKAANGRKIKKNSLTSKTSEQKAAENIKELPATKPISADKKENSASVVLEEKVNNPEKPTQRNRNNRKIKSSVSQEIQEIKEVAAEIPKIETHEPKILEEQPAVSSRNKWKNRKNKNRNRKTEREHKKEANTEEKKENIIATVDNTFNNQQVKHEDKNKKNRNQNKNKNKDNKNVEIVEKSTSAEPHIDKKSVKPIPYVDLAKIDVTRKPLVQKQLVEFVPVNSNKLLKPLERKDPFFQNFFREVEKFAINEMLIENNSKVVVGVSGGVDSVVLLDVMAILADKYNFAVYVAHYNHNLRGKASAEDERFVKSLAASYNIPYYWASGKVQQHAEKHNMSIEESARYLRYFFFERTTRTLDADFLATAHTADDSVETFLLNLFRGSGLTGLSGIPSRRQLVKEVMLIRPFIFIKKHKIIEYAEKRGLKWREDDSNLLDKYTRNKIRNDLIPKLKKEYSPAIVDIINRSAKLIHGADKMIHDYVRTHLPSVLTDISTERISIKVLLFKTFDEFIRGEMLQSILMKYFRMLSPSMNIVDRLMKLENSEVGAICEITNTIFAIRDRQVITISRKSIPNKINEKVEKTGKFHVGNIVFVLKEVGISEVEYNNNPNIEYFDFNLISQIITIRNWEIGDEFNPLGMKGKMKVNDFLSNEKIPILEKPNILVMATGNNEIIWICKKRINDKFKVTTDTKRVLKVEIKDRTK